MQFIFYTSNVYLIVGSLCAISSLHLGGAGRALLGLANRLITQKETTKYIIVLLQHLICYSLSLIQFNMYKPGFKLVLNFSELFMFISIALTLSKPHTTILQQTTLNVFCQNI